MSLGGALPIFRSDLQVRLLGLVLLNADRVWSTAELRNRLEATPVSIHRELRRALDAGLVTREGIGRAHLYRAATDSPLYEPLSLLLQRTVGVEVELQHALQDVPGIEAAFVHGSFAHEAKLHPTSDVDLLVLGHVSHPALRKRLRDVERRIGREIDVLAYEPDEFASMVRRGNGFARSIIEGPVRAVIGSLDDLHKLANAG